MNQIQVLDKATIDKIAAGEVVDRPASVVKELLENAIDAMATAITVEIKDGGKTMIRITDNGSGIPEDQIRTAFLRHATSKIRTAEDLLQVASLGFRGEALSSIAAVSQVELITKTPEALTGTRYCVEGGTETGFEEIGAPSGTTIIVRNLFFNTPARAKFLKTDQTEGNHIASIVEELALSHPAVSFRFILNGQNRLYTSGNGNLREIVYQIFGRELNRKLIPMDYEKDGFHLHGFLGSPEIARGNRGFEYYYVNGRYVKSRVITKAIEDAYSGFLMRHRYPFTLLYLELDGKSVDVNVHPSKMEVRISHEDEVYHRICLAVQNALFERERIPEVNLGETRSGSGMGKPSGGKKTEDSVSGREAKIPEPFEIRRSGMVREKKERENPASGDEKRSRDAAAFRFREQPGSYTAAGENSQGPAKSAAPAPEGAGKGTQAPADSAPAPEGTGKAAQGPADSVPDPAGDGRSGAGGSGRNDFRSKPVKGRQEELFDPAFLSHEAIKSLRILGQIFGTYWLIEYDDSLYIMDQHAAHEKVNYERLMKSFREKKIQSQRVFPSPVVTLTAAEADTLDQHMDAFRSLGFEIEPFGGRDYKITAVPANLYQVSETDLFTDILDQLGDLGDPRPDVILERLASMSCKAAVKGNQRMSAAEAEALIRELLTLENPYNCPHGRPTIIRMSHAELDRKFKRIL